MFSLTQKAVGWLDRRGWLDRFPWLRRIGWPEVGLLVIALVVVFVAHAFLELAESVQRGKTQNFDEWVIRSLRRPDDPALPIGPEWLREVGLDLTALGSVVVLLLVIASIAGFLLLQRKRGIMWLVLIATAGGMVLNFGLKLFFARERPSIVPHLREVITPSFPSGHATLSAVVYLTLGAVLAGVVRGHLTKFYCIGVAMLLAFLVGISRVYLGVHYPTDVLAGWSVGLVWALACFIVARVLRYRGKIESPAPVTNEVDDQDDETQEEVRATTSAVS